MLNMNLIIYVNNTCAEERALFDLDKEEVILYGDYQHNKIEDKIDGYLEALRDFDIHTDDVAIEWINEDHKHFKKVYFNTLRR